MSLGGGSSAGGGGGQALRPSGIRRVGDPPPMPMTNPMNLGEPLRDGPTLGNVLGSHTAGVTARWDPAHGQNWYPSDLYGGQEWAQAMAGRQPMAADLAAVRQPSTRVAGNAPNTIPFYTSGQHRPHPLDPFLIDPSVPAGQNWGQPTWWPERNPNPWAYGQPRSAARRGLYT